MKKAFTLVEVLIVVAILGILAAIVIPHFQSQSQQAKEAAAKDNLRVLRNTIELYAAQHSDLPPGYFGEDTTPISYFPWQLTNYTNVEGFIHGTKSKEYCFGPYLKALPKNPFNGKALVIIVHDGVPFPETYDGLSGWTYKPETKTIKLNWPGTDAEGTSYYEY